MNEEKRGRSSMNNANKFNEKFAEEWKVFTKQFMRVSTETATETAGAAAEVLRTLAKEFGALGERLEKWVEKTEKTEKTAEPEGQSQSSSRST